MPLQPGEVLIHEGNFKQFINPTVDGETKKCTAIPRDWARHPHGAIPGIPAASISKIPRSEWSGRIAERVASKSLISDLRTLGKDGSIVPSRDQNGKGYCWAHSSTTAAICKRFIEGQPYADLSAYAIACMIKGFRDEGGWNAESCQFIREKGCPTSKTWAQQSMSRSNDNAATWEEAAKYKITEWEDIANNDFDTLMSALLLGFPCPIDEDWWSHSICAIDPIDGTSSQSRMNTRMESGKLAMLSEFEKIWEVNAGGGFGVRIWNSWGDSWSDRGMGVLTESKGTPNGAYALRVMTAAA